MCRGRLQYVLINNLYGAVRTYECLCFVYRLTLTRVACANMLHTKTRPASVCEIFPSTSATVGEEFVVVGVIAVRGLFSRGGRYVWQNAVVGHTRRWLNCFGVVHEKPVVALNESTTSTG